MPAGTGSLYEREQLYTNSSQNKLGKRIVVSYPELTHHTLRSQSQAKRLVQIFIRLMQLSVCLVYHLCAIVLLLDWNISAYQALALVFMVAMGIPMSWILDINRLTPTHLMANILILDVLQEGMEAHHGYRDIFEITIYPGSTSFGLMGNGLRSSGLMDTSSINIESIISVAVNFALRALVTQALAAIHQVLAHWLDELKIYEI